ncbi:hypothetical protein VIGAN_02210900 [Vigna angularis var. angularis]|uniref:glucan endo-1,3-beta-D-glucosidase n=1 Tax=Vigna angularis var. angularis TaxID=157739 RepID=A0A0S3RFC9_PHAAN|nr:hypothetical protein VIGAN_02210900 [Vigna angularis var. angularis]
MEKRSKSWKMRRNRSGVGGGNLEREKESWEASCDVNLSSSYVLVVPTLASNSLSTFQSQQLGFVQPQPIGFIQPRPLSLKFCRLFSLESSASFNINLLALFVLAPYNLYSLNPEIPLGIALFQEYPFNFCNDFTTGVHYRNLFDVMVDVVIALAIAGYETIPLVVTETGWPSFSVVENEFDIAEGRLRWLRK